MVCVLAVSGTSYIGASACKAFKAKGYTPATFDNLFTAWQNAVKFAPPFIRGLIDQDALAQAFGSYK